MKQSFLTVLSYIFLATTTTICGIPQLNFGTTDTSDTNEESHRPMTSETSVDEDQVTSVQEKDAIYFPGGSTSSASRSSIGELRLPAGFSSTEGEDKTAEPELKQLCPEIKSKTDANYTRYDETYKKCGRIGYQRHCPENMLFYSYPESPVYGQCDCEYVEGLVKPFVYNLERNRCYRLFEQGYCNSQQWLVPKKNEAPKCARNRCTNIFAGTVRQNSSDFVVYKGECVRVDEPHRDCKPSEVIMFNVDEKLVPHCVDKSIFAGLRAVGTIGHLKCKPGTYLSITGKCQKAYTWGR